MNSDKDPDAVTAKLRQRLPIFASMRKSMIASAVVLTGCTSTSVYLPPASEVTHDAWKDGQWQSASPADNRPRGEWWKVYGDLNLDALESKIETANPTLASALARYEQANAYVKQLRSGLYPTIDAGDAVTQNRQSENRPLRSANQPNVYAAQTIGAAATYELDLWGKVRNQIASGEAAAQAESADVATIKLSLQAELALNYFRLRGIDEQAKLLNDTVDAYSHALALTRNRHAGGIASGLDVSRAETQFSTVRVELSEGASQRALYEHAIATLIGEPAMNFSLSASHSGVAIPLIPLGLPSTLLQRRPDIAAAERRIAAANAGVGVARAAYFPDLSLNAGYGFQNTGAANLLSLPNSFWTLGPSVIFNIFDGGLRDAKLRQARAKLDEEGATYRAVTLVAFQQVEDELSSLKYERESEFDELHAVESATKTLELAINRYREGAVNYLEVATAQTAALATRRRALDLHDRQLQTSVDLIRALGGGWAREAVPGDKGQPANSPDKATVTARND